MGWCYHLHFDIYMIFIICFIYSLDGNWKLTPTIMTVFFFILMISSWFLILKPIEWEIVIENDCIHWGRVKKFHKHKTIPITDIKEIHYNSGPENDRTYLVLKNGKRKNMLDMILYYEDKKRSFIKSISENYPDIDIKEGK